MSRPTHRRAALLGAALVSMATTVARSVDAPPAGPRPTSGPTTAPADPVINRIRDEGLRHSQVMATLDTLCNVIGPRLTGSPGQKHASEWTRDQLAKWGLSNAHLEPWGPFGRGWAMDWFTLQTVAPYTVRLTAVPKAWSPGFDRPIEADVVYIEARTRPELDKYKGTLRGKIVLLGRPRPVTAHFEPQAARMDDAELARLAKVGADKDVGVDELMRPPGGRPSTTGPAAGPRPPGAQPTTQSLGLGRQAARLFQPQALAFLQAEGAALVIDPSSQGDGGTIYVAQASLPYDGPIPNFAVRPSTTGPTTVPTTGPAGAATGQAAGASPGGPTASPAALAFYRSFINRPKVWSVDAPPTPPQATMADEDYNRVVSLLAHGQPVRVAADLRVHFYPPDQTLTANTVAELSGTDLKDQIVMCGGHLDSWHGGTGATDNGVGAAAAMEAIRILKALDLHPRRTIRVALWTGEEQGLYGSTAYVKQHFGYFPESPEPTTGPTTGPTTRRARRPRPALVRGPEYEQLSTYFNLDNGTGKVRGIYAQSNPAAAKLFRQWLAPLSDLGASTVTLADTGSTDHISFDDVGLPGFQFIQDPIEYGTRTHHSTADVYDRIQPDDMAEASTVMAVMLWDAANAPERFPRKPLKLPQTPGR